MQNQISLKQVQFKNDKVLLNLKSYLAKISSYNNFDADMELIIWTHQPDNDFMALEAKEYMLGFSSYAYKPSSFMSSEVNRCDTNYNSLCSHLE
jgi:hypothetical protein